MFTIVCENLSDPNRHGNSNNSFHSNTENPSRDGGKAFDVLKSCLNKCSMSLCVLLAFLLNTSDSSLMIYQQFLLLCFWLVYYGTYINLKMWESPSINVYAVLHALAYKQKNLLPRMATSFFTSTASDVSLSSANVDHRWMPSYESNQQDNVLAREWTLMSKGPAWQSLH